MVTPGSLVVGDSPRNAISCLRVYARHFRSWMLLGFPRSIALRFLSFFMCVVQRAGASSGGGADRGPFAAAGQSSDHRAPGCTNAHALSGFHVPFVSNVCRAPVLDCPPPVLDRCGTPDVMMAGRLLNHSAGLAGS